MPRICTVCSHPDRAAIDAALLSGAESVGSLARRFKVGPDSLERHRKAHLGWETPCDTAGLSTATVADSRTPKKKGAADREPPPLPAQPVPPPLPAAVQEPSEPPPLPVVADTGGYRTVVDGSRRCPDCGSDDLRRSLEGIVWCLDCHATPRFECAERHPT